MLDYALKKARELAEQYHMYALDRGATRKCEKAFLWTCGEFVNKNIQVKYLPDDIGPMAMLGTIITYADKYVILLKPGLPVPAERFVLCKELFHVVFDSDMLYSMNLAKHLQLTLFERLENVPAHVASEYFSHAAAAEFLFPHAQRMEVKQRGGQIDLAEIARSHDIPLPVVDFYMADTALTLYKPE